MSQIDELVSELKIKIIKTLGLMDVTPADIKDDAPLVGGDTGIDSIDVLELVMMIEKDYGVKIDSKELELKCLLQCVRWQLISLIINVQRLNFQCRKFNL